jgi:hypothetical protein
MNQDEAASCVSFEGHVCRLPDERANKDSNRVETVGPSIEVCSLRVYSASFCLAETENRSDVTVVKRCLCACLIGKPEPDLFVVITSIAK